MNEVLAPLAELPGVEFVMMLTPDGVPITVVESPEMEASTAAPDGPLAQGSREDGIAALAGGWINELIHAVGPLSWGSPERVVMRCARGTLVMRPIRGAILLMLLDTSMAPEHVRLPMAGAVKRLERNLRSDATESTPLGSVEEPPGALPSGGERSMTEPEPAAVESLEISSEEELPRD